MDTQAYEAILDSINSPIVFVDNTHTIRYLNEAARIRYYEERGYANLIGKSLFDCHHPASQQAILRLTEDAGTKRRISDCSEYLMNGCPASSRQQEMDITRGDIPIALDIMREAASWLVATGRPLWRLEDSPEERILRDRTSDNICVGWVGEESVAAMILQWRDPMFWPNAADDSAFIHKLSVRRRFAGTGAAREMVAWAMQEARQHGKQYLRLDCAGERPRLCAFYESLCFRQVDRRMLGAFDVAFYQSRYDEKMLFVFFCGYHAW